MNILVYGAGALGAYFGLRFQEAGHSVQYLVREKRASLLDQHGLHIQSVKGDYQAAQVSYIRSAEEAKNIDLVILAVKGHHLSGAIDDLKILALNGAKVLPLLNGIEHIRVLQQELGEEHVIGGMSFIIATLNDQGHVVHTSEQHDLVFGSLHPSQDSICQEFLELCEGSNMNVRQSDNILYDMWRKYMFISAVSGVTTAGDYNIGVFRSNEETMKTATRMLQEMKTLANAYDIEVTEQDVEIAVSQINSMPEDATSSMHQDRRKGLTLEVEHLQGGALRLAQKVDLDLPVTETLYGLIKPYQNA
ncbi:2-dehydropantoate 2-reductase [Bacillus ectoiniformans]|uniref:ketopantoate reductase family protein n=1 Tax=Bacillus ectoiniformans TaxID=1494429 RepID=UPI001956DDD5|nr:ketopantoate reductase family protein [Bacillus ectoiniformans]MBM7649113.1 2-dehydropantoate 2-reductase [Bacillus ectoiniformans]